MSLPTRITIAVNPLSGQFKPEILCSVEKFLKTHGFKVTPLIKDFRGLKRMEWGGEDCVMVVGGDGSINMAINAIGPGKVPICIIPTGTGNALAKELGLPTRRPEMAVRFLNRGRRKKVDVGSVDGKYFLLMVGAGFDAQVAKRVTHRAKQWLKIGGYAASAMLEIWKYKPQSILIRQVGKMTSKDTYYRGETILFCNARTYGGPLSFARRAQIDDGLLDIVVFRRMGVLMGALYLLMGLGLEHSSICRYVDYFKSSEVEISPPSPTPYQADGDYCGILPSKITLLPRRQEFFVPA